MFKTNALRALDANKIEYEFFVYDDAGEFHSADEAAALLGAPVDQVYKTLVVLHDDAGARKKPMLVMIPAAREIELRVLAKSVGAKKLRMATKKEAERLTGAQIGGISALAQLNKGFEMLLDETARELEWLHVSGGARGLDVKLRVQDLLRVTKAKFTRATADRADAASSRQEASYPRKNG
ncbi:aminoacyl-tRNA deacylase [Anaerolineae bacterium CFX7]|nr:aminoacyl-tRNA deacylase [Anaerolineae bacterium CFX7]